MGFALTFPFAGLLAQLHRAAARALSRVAQRQRAGAPRPAAAGLHCQDGQGQVAWSAARDARPLRVLRVVEDQHGRTSAGRMVISGRMADVCAELDRLAALEAAAA